jgi:D-alanine-D-alanine ligase
MGGKSSEREVSLSTGKMILKALDPAKYATIAVDTGATAEVDTKSGIVGLRDIIGNRAGFRPDVAFIALHGKYGEDGTVQGLLELLGIPYIGSGVLASALAMDKIMARKVLDYEGIPIPKGISVKSPEEARGIISTVEKDLGYPVVVKPNRQGSTIGLSIAHNAAEYESSIELAFKHDDDVLLEQFISGVEITCPVLGNDDAESLPIIEIVPQSGFYDYHDKYTDGATKHIVPARLSENVYRMAQELALACHKVLGCRGMSRTDMIVRGEEIFILEVNTIPGMTPTSLLPHSAQAAGIGFSELLDRLIEYALSGGRGQ